MGEGFMDGVRKIVSTILKPREEKQFLAWSQSATGHWGEEELLGFRDVDPVTLAKSLLISEQFMWNSTVVELFAHGNYRKAAAVVRCMEEEDPEAGKYLRAFYKRKGPAYTILFEKDLLELASTPEEVALRNRPR